MKNISRRVFIKGLAVAGVAAAASTVLAGCNTNMIPGVDDGAEDDTTEETPAKNQVVEYTDDNGKKLTFTAAGCTNVADGKMVVLSFDIDNGTDTDLVIASKATTSTTHEGKYYILNTASKAKAYFDGSKNVAGSINTTDISGKGDNLFVKDVTVDGTSKKSYNVYITGVPKDWSKVTLTFDVMMGTSAVANNYLVRPAEFTFENK